MGNFPSNLRNCCGGGEPENGDSKPLKDKSRNGNETNPRSSGLEEKEKPGSKNESSQRVSGRKSPPRLSDISDKLGYVTGEEITTPRTSTEDESYLADKDLKDFDDGMHQKTKMGLDSLEQGLKRSGSLQLQSLKDVVTVLMEMDQDVVNFILKTDIDKWINNTEMKNLVTNYFEQSLEVLTFYGCLKKCVERARDNQQIIARGISLMPTIGDPDGAQCLLILHELNKYAEAEHPFSEELFDYLNQVRFRQVELQKRLSARSRRLETKEKNAGALRKVTTVMLTASCASMVILAAVALAVTAPIRNVKVSAAAAEPFEALQGWLGSLWSSFEKKCEVEKGAVGVAKWGAFVAISDLDSVKAEIDNLMIDKDSIIRNIEFGQQSGDVIAVRLAVGKIRVKQDLLEKNLEILSEHVDYCRDKIVHLRKVVLQKIVEKAD